MLAESYVTLLLLYTSRMLEAGNILEIKKKSVHQPVVYIQDEHSLHFRGTFLVCGLGGQRAGDTGVAVNLCVMQFCEQIQL